MTRRTACRDLTLACLALGSAPTAFTCGAEAPKYRPKYILSSAMYSTLPLESVLAEVPKIGASQIDIWTRPHADHREVVDKIGLDAFAEMLRAHQVELGVLTNYPLGPFRIAKDLKPAKRLGGEAVLCGTGQPSEPKGEEARRAVSNFLESMKPHVEQAEDMGMTILLENHDRQLLYTPDSLRYFRDLNRSPRLKIAYAIHHMQTAAPDQIAPMLEELGNQAIGFIYFQEQGLGLRNKVPREEEYKQLPGQGGGVDYRPIMSALRKIDFQGWVEIFMHPTPRGIPVKPTAAEVTALINRSRRYVEQFLANAP